MARMPVFQIWTIGDRVRFAHEQPDGPIHVVTGILHSRGQPMVEIEDLPGQFGAHLFIAANYPADSIVPRKA
jgi:hypothetical protein